MPYKKAAFLQIHQWFIALGTLLQHLTSFKEEAEQSDEKEIQWGCLVMTTMLSSVRNHWAKKEVHSSGVWHLKFFISKGSSLMKDRPCLSWDGAELAAESDHGFSSISAHQTHWHCISEQIVPLSSWVSWLHSTTTGAWVTTHLLLFQRTLTAISVYFRSLGLGSSRMRAAFCHVSSYFCAMGWGRESAALVWDLYFNLLLMEHTHVSHLYPIIVWWQVASSSF